MNNQINTIEEFEKEYCSKCIHYEDSKSIFGAFNYCRDCIDNFKTTGKASKYES